MNTFYNDKIRLSEELKTQLRDFRDVNLQRVKDGTNKISETDNTSYKNFIKDVSQGSMAMHTVNQAQNNDDHDIDHALIYEKADIDDDPKKAREFVARAINNTNVTFKKNPEARTNAVTVWYQNGYHVDFAIYRRYEDSWGNEILEHAGSEWKGRDPNSITNWFNEKNNQKSPSKDDGIGSYVRDKQLRRVVRLFKFWSNSRSGWSLPGGLVLSVLVEECYVADRNRDDVSFYQTMNAIKNRLIWNKDVRNPVDTSLSLIETDKHKKQVEYLEKRLKTWLDALSPLFEDSCDELTARKSWGKFFKNNWWSTEVKKSDTVNLSNQVTAYSMDIKIFVYTKSGLLMGEYNPDGTSTLPKGVNLKFKIRTNYPYSYTIDWEVKNEGDEAEIEGQASVRKGIVDTNDFHICNEKTAFKGNHKMTCRLMSGGSLVASKDVEVRIR